MVVFLACDRIRQPQGDVISDRYAEEHREECFKIPMHSSECRPTAGLSHSILHRCGGTRQPDQRNQCIAKKFQNVTAVSRFVWVCVQSLLKPCSKRRVLLRAEDSHSEAIDGPFIEKQKALSVEDVKDAVQNRMGMNLTRISRGFAESVEHTSEGGKCPQEDHFGEFHGSVPYSLVFL
jgi:hypothetical protein